MKRVLLVGLLVGIAFAVIASEPVKVIMATTDDGRRVILMPDGKWNFVEGVPASKNPKDNLWSDLTSYFSSWDLALADKDSGVIQTQWKILSRKDLGLDGMGEPFRVRVKISVQEGSKVAVETWYQSKASVTEMLTGIQTGSEARTGKAEWYEHDYRIEDFKPRTSLNRKLIEFDSKLKSDTKALSDKYRLEPCGN